jgi:hypothetical protein
VANATLRAEEGSLQVTTRPVLGGTMLVQRRDDELFLHGATIGPDSTAWLERVDPETLEPIARIDALPAGPWWPGGALAHANGDLYMTQGRWCHRLSPELELVASCELPRDRPYNSLLALPDGRLVMKDMSSDDALPSQLVLLDDDALDIRATYDLPEGSIARLSADDQTVCVVGMQSIFALRCESDTIDETGRTRYRALDGQTFGWDAVLDGSGSVWLLDNGDGTEAFGGSFVGQTSSTAPLHLVRAAWPLLSGAHAELYEICGEPGGIVANPPMIVPEARVAIGFDSGHGVISAWRWSDSGGPLAPLWRRQQNHAAHVLVYPDSNEVVTFDFDVHRGMDQCVVVDIESGAELARVDTGSPVQSVVFPCPGWNRDFYTLTFTTLTRVAVT